MTKLLILKKLKSFGFTLNESSDFIAMIEERQASCCKVSAKISGKIAVIDDKIRELQQVRRMLANGVALCLNGRAPSIDGNCEMLVP
ncbi:MerR family DNA-binding protein [Sediminibacterium sp. WSJ-3]|nr:MerR family DNA-binding protein [Sediminibacterium soli]